MWHLDLKPENILLDHNMDPKIADFGLSKLFTNPTTKVIQIGGTTDYVPPEYKLRGRVTDKYDIFSLGVVIIEMMAGIGTYRIIDDFDSHEEVIKLVLEKWNYIFSGYREQVKACIEIALKCVEIKPKNRPELTYIIDNLKTVENIVPPTPLSQNSSKYEGSSTGEMSQGLSVHPIELQFSLGLGANKLINSWPLRLTNNTDNNIVYRLDTKHLKKHFGGFLCGIVLPMSTCTLVVAMREWLELPSDNEELFVLESIVAGDHDMDHLRSYEATYQYEFFFTETKRKGRAVHQVKLTAAYIRHQVKLTAAYIRPGPEKQVYEPMMITSNIRLPTSIDVHPTEPWTMTYAEGDRRVYIWDYRMKEVKSVLKVSSSTTNAVTLAKFIASKQLIVAGVSDGSIWVYSYGREQIIYVMREHSGSVTSLAIHATEPYMLSASKDGTVKLWNYEKDWELMKTIQMNPWQDTVRAVAFDPKGTDLFAAARGSTVEIWNWRSGERELVFSGSPNKVVCLDYCSSGDELYLIASYHGDSTKGKIWDYHTGHCVHELELHTSYVTAVCSHSDLQILITGSYDGSVHLWHSTSFRLMGRLNLGLGLIKDLKCLKDSRRIVIACYRGLVLAEIDMIMGRA